MSEALRPSARSWARMLGVALVVLAVDQATKVAVRSSLDPGERHELLLGIDLVRTSNTGVAFGLLDGLGAGILALIAAAAVAALLVWFALDGGHRWMEPAIGLLAGGAMGNVVDRLLRGRVTDFVDLPGWPAFNLADVGITSGVAILVVGTTWAGRTHLRGDHPTGDGGQPPRENVGDSPRSTRAENGEARPGDLD